MNGNEFDSGKKNPPQGASSISILDLILILLERKFFLLISLSLISAAVIIYTLLVSPQYKATAIVLAAKKQDMSSLGGALKGGLGDLPIGGLFKGFDMFEGADNDRFLSILDSRPLAEKVIERFDLLHRYEFHKRKRLFFEDLIREFKSHLVYEEDEELKNIIISVTDTNPRVAAEMTNFIVLQLDSLNYQINRQSATGSRRFFEERLPIIRNGLDSAQKALAAFQLKFNFYAGESQTKSTIEALSSFESESMRADLQRDLLSGNYANNTMLDEIKRNQQIIKKRLDTYLEKGSGSIVLPLKKIPEMSIEFTSLFRDLQIQEVLYSYLLHMYEQAKFREANNSPAVNVLQYAATPQKRSWPKRGMLCIVVFFASFALLTIYILVDKWFGIQRRDGTVFYHKFGAVVGHFRLRK